MGHFGFSYIGLIALLMLFIPNLFWIRQKPADYDDSDENKLLLAFERIGQVSSVPVALIFSVFNPQLTSPRSIQLFRPPCYAVLQNFAGFVVFRRTWCCQFLSKSVWYPGSACRFACLFLCLGIYGKVVWMIPSVVILGVGHIGIHLQHLKNEVLFTKSSPQRLLCGLLFTKCQFSCHADNIPYRVH